jgi:hypothetical protein
MPILSRVWFAFLCFFRVVFDGAFAARVHALREGAPALLLATDQPEHAGERELAKPAPPKPSSASPALQLLSLLQREGRLVDFLQQDIAGFSDSEIGSAARVVHEGCRKALTSHAEIVPVRSEAEGVALVLQAGFDARAIKLTGNVHGSAPYRGTLRHRGWRAQRLELPELVGDHDASVLAPAEVEL